MPVPVAAEVLQDVIDNGEETIRDNARSVKALLALS